MECKFFEKIKCLWIKIKVEFILVLSKMLCTHVMASLKGIASSSQALVVLLKL